MNPSTMPTEMPTLSGKSVNSASWFILGDVHRNVLLIPSVQILFLSVSAAIFSKKEKKS